MKASIQNLIQELHAVVMERGELEFRDMSELKITFATSGLSEFQFRCRDHILRCLETSSLLQV